MMSIVTDVICLLRVSKGSAHVPLLRTCVGGVAAISIAADFCDGEKTGSPWSSAGLEVTYDLLTCEPSEKTRFTASHNHKARK